MYSGLVQGSLPISDILKTKQKKPNQKPQPKQKTQQFDMLSKKCPSLYRRYLLL